MTKISIFSTALLASAVAFGLAAPASALTLDQVVQHGMAAKQSTDRYEITEDIAKKISDACETYAKANNIRVSIFILDTYGNIVQETRMDGQMKFNIDTALMKAKTALTTHGSTHALANQDVENPYRHLQQMQVDDQYPYAGGLPIIVDDTLLGAIGVASGSNKDEDCAYTALTQVLGPQPPLPPGATPRL